MEPKELCISKYRRLLQLLDDDFMEIAQGLSGEMLDAYRRILKEEKALLENALKSMQTQI